MGKGNSETVGAQKRELIPLFGKDRKGLHIGGTIKPGPEE